MARIRIPVTNFSFGEISPSFKMRTDTAVYTQSAESVKNFFIRAEGGLIKRAGTQRLYEFSHTYDSSLNQQIRIEPFIFSDDEKYIAAFSTGKINMFRIAPNGTVTHIQELTQDVNADALPFTDANVPQFTFAQRGDYMFIAHTNFLCRMLVRTGLTTFEVQTFQFDESTDGYKKYQPYYNFQGNSISIQPSGTTGSVTLTTSAPYFDTSASSDQVGVRLLIGETEAIITAITNSTTATATIQGTLETRLGQDALRTTNGTQIIEVTHPLHGLSAGDSITISEAGTLGGISASNLNGTFTIADVLSENEYTYDCGHAANDTLDGGGAPLVQSTAASYTWYEQSYSAYRGFPQAIVFHEDRLWFAGTPSQPDGIWGSRTGQYFNFDIGKAEDSDSLDLSANIGTTNQIRHLVSNRDLQVFASQQEFFIPSFQDRPITPANAKISAQTPFGSGYVRPQSLDGATLFVQGTGTAVREFLYADIEGAYVGDVVSLAASHLIDAPVQLATVKGSLSRPGAYGMFLMSNGSIGVFYSIRNEKRAGWANWTTSGKFHSVCSVEEDLFCVSVRDNGSGTNKLYLEQFKTDMNMDFADDFTGTAGVFSVSSHFANGAEVDVVDGTEYLGTFTVSGGNLDVSAVKESTSIQAGYKMDVEIKTLPLDAVVQGGPLSGQPRKITRIIVDVADTLSMKVNGKEMIIRNVNDDMSLGRNAVTEKREFRPLGYSRDPRVIITQSAPLDLQVNGMIVEVAF